VWENYYDGSLAVEDRKELRSKTWKIKRYRHRNEK
jgi:hypothetical protein